MDKRIQTQKKNYSIERWLLFINIYKRINYIFLSTKNLSSYAIYLCGSYANGYQTQFSDIDIHIVVDFLDINDNTTLVRKFFDAVKSVNPALFTEVKKFEDIPSVVYFESTHWGKMMFRWVYWNLMMKGLELPLEPQMNIAGKVRQSA